MISPLASVSPKAKIGANVTIEPFSCIYDDVEIGDNTWIGPNVTIMNGARIGSDCRFFPGCVISAIPQDLKFDGEDSLTIIGNHSTIREAVTINRGTKARGYTQIGEHCLIMATAHIAHDCVLGNHVVIVNGVGIAGHVEIGDYSILGGLSAVHQFGRIGQHVMVSGGTLVRKDVPSYITVGKEPVAYMGVNSTGLKRRGFTTESINLIQKAYHILFQQGLNTSQALLRMATELQQTPEILEIINSVKLSERGIVKGLGKRKKD